MVAAAKRPTQAASGSDSSLTLRVSFHALPEEAPQTIASRRCPRGG
jgi:hypothetical protein